jgi:hypothetical protein
LCLVIDRSDFEISLCFSNTPGVLFSSHSIQNKATITKCPKFTLVKSVIETEKAITQQVYVKQVQGCSEYTVYNFSFQQHGVFPASL